LLEQAEPIPKHGIFYQGQIFDAYHFASGLVKRANDTIILIDNYINEDTLNLLAKRKKHVQVTLYAEKSNQIRYNRQNSA
jgi:hypothetical protein